MQLQEISHIVKKKTNKIWPEEWPTFRPGGINMH